MLDKSQWNKRRDIGCPDVRTGQGLLALSGARPDREDALSLLYPERVAVLQNVKQPFAMQ